MRRSRLPIAWLIAVTAMPVMAVAQTTNPADDAAQFKKDKADAEEELNNMWKGLPQLPPQPIREIVLIGKANKLLNVSSPALPRAVSKSTIQIADLPGKASLAVLWLPPQNELPGNSYLNFDYYNTTDANDVETHIQIVIQPGSIELVYDIEFPDGTLQQVTLRQVDSPQPPTHPVELRVHVFKEDVRASQQDSTFSADDLDALIYQHPVEVEKYLRPLLREIRQDDRVLGLNENAAWQVLAPLYKPSTELAAKINALVAQFKSDDFAVRAQVAKDLKSLGGPAAAYLLNHNRQGRTEEQSARIDEFLHGFRLLTDSQAEANLRNPDFLIDCLGSENRELRAMALAQLSTVIGHSVQFNINASADDRAAAIERLRQLISPIAPPTRPS